MNRRRLVLLAVPLALLIGAGAIAWSLLLRPIDVRVGQSERNVLVQVFGLGTVEARVTSKIGFKVSGVLVELRADVGDRVAKGRGSRPSRRPRAESAGRQGQVRPSSRLKPIFKGPKQASKRQGELRQRQSINQRRQTLLQSNNTSVETAQTAKAAQDATLGDLNLANSDVLVAQANISDAKAQQQQQSATLDFHTLTAPYDAMVTARLKELGSALGAGEPVFTLIDPKSVWVLAYIDESKAGEIKVGEPAEIVLRSQPGQRIAGHVARIEPESDRVNEERQVEIAFEKIPKGINLGEQAEVYITTVQLPQALLVPEAAIVGLGKNRGTVWTVENGHLQQHEVTLGHRLLDGRYEITGGLPDKAQVVAAIAQRAARSAARPRSPKGQSR